MKIRISKILQRNWIQNNKSINFYLKSKRSKTFKEDDNEYFGVSTAIKLNKQNIKQTRENELYSAERLLTDNFELKYSSSGILNYPEYSRSKSVIPSNIQKSYEILGRVKKSSKTNFIK